MLETILLLVATALVFGVFFLVFLLRKPSSDRPARFHNCGSCNCGNDGHRGDFTDLHTAPEKKEPCRNDPAHVS
jgi:hypothetical protein